MHQPFSARPSCVRRCGFTRHTQPGLGLLENSGFENVPHRLDKLEPPEGQTSPLHGTSWQACITVDDWAEPSRPGWGSEPVGRTECSLVRRQEWGTAGAERLRFAVCRCPERRLQPTATSKLLSQPVTSN